MSEPLRWPARPSEQLDADLDDRLVGAGRRLRAGDLIRARSGNASARRAAHVRITVAGARLHDLGPGDLTWMSLEGEPLGPAMPSSEAAMHAAIYRARPEVGAVVHTHSPYATAWASAATRLEMVLEEASYYGMGTAVHVAPHATAGSAHLAHLAVAHLGDGAAVLLERHGVVAVGADVESALDVAESLEHQAKVAWLLARLAPG